MKICIFGAGAIGSLFGGFLAKEHEVTLICREAHAEAIQSNGLRITGLSELHVHPKAVTEPGRVEIPDVLFITVKSYDTAAAARAARELVGPETLVVSLQNGLGNLEAIAAGLPDASVLGAVTSHGAIFREPGHVEHTGYSYTMAGGEEAEKIARMLSEAGIDTAVSDNIRVDIWCKAIVNSVINPIGTLMNDRNGLLIRDELFWPLARQIVSEGVAVARAKGIDLDENLAFDKVVRVATETANNICSMRLDIERGRRTEIDYMNGAIARYGSEEGIPAPANGLLAALVRSLETDE